jgi:hypothetical protein
MITRKSFLTVLLVPTGLLLIPLVANFTVDGFNWNPGSFVFFWAILVGVGFAYKWVTRKTGSVAHRIATGLALLAGFMIVWGNLAVGFIGGEDNPANLLYFVALLVVAICAGVSRFTPSGMARAMFIGAFAVAWVPAIALLTRPHDFSPGVAQVFGLNAFFVLMFVVSGFLFRLGGGARGDAGALRKV